MSGWGGGKSHSLGKCGLCGESIKRNGLSMVSHLRMHVRKGDLVERGHIRPVEFKSAKDKNDTFAQSGAYF